MNVTGRTKIWRKDFNGKPAYSRSIASQEFKDGVKGDWIRDYEAVQFKGGADIPNGTSIEVKDGFEAVYNSRDGVKRKLIVVSYEVLDMPSESVGSGFMAINDDDVPF